MKKIINKHSNNHSLHNPAVYSRCIPGTTKRDTGVSGMAERKDRECGR